MKKLIITSSAVLISLSLVSCNTMNDASQFSNRTVGTGIKYGAQTVGTGVGYVTNAGAFVGRGVGTVVGTGVGVITRHPASYQAVKTNQKNGMIYHNGHHYKLQNGKYVLVR